MQLVLFLKLLTVTVPVHAMRRASPSKLFELPKVVTALTVRINVNDNSNALRMDKCTKCKIGEKAGMQWVVLRRIGCLINY